MKIKCPNCRGIFHSVTDKYNPDVLPNGSMIKLLDKYAKLHWSAFADGLGAHLGTAYSSMRCPSCTASMLIKNRLVVIPEPEAEIENIPEFKCDVCGKVCKSKLGLLSHSRSHRS